MLNQTQIMGRLVEDPVLRRTGNGTACCRFTLAVERDFKSQDGNRKADFIDCMAWRGTAEFVCRNFKKGQMAAVQGRIQTEIWEGNDARKQKSVEVVVENIYFAGAKKDTHTEERDFDSVPAPGNPFRDLEEDDGDLPF